MQRFCVDLRAIIFNEMDNNLENDSELSDLETTEPRTNNDRITLMSKEIICLKHPNVFTNETDNSTLESMSTIKLSSN